MKPGPSYSYNPATDTFTISADRLALMLYRVGAPKEKIAEEDREENVRRRIETRYALAVPKGYHASIDDDGNVYIAHPKALPYSDGIE